ncbi:glucosaminidase domain-containing protein [Variovorax sp. NFACC27]|uniref:glucosaminidase domain-containing protein n=1 Tax=unclassified Variovorax TaxID=663243 RepID=UPI00089A1054|nr:Flagellum-specific peptidoglycan hydrolase FlgJ [Variovorax sp. NFACC28]SEG89706.1 Flagellum-specific peptidoglycan hydrolase FlgJ [Variovorax sp. NFACC29]SFD40018.1 Flagellum-specific peptidoglycan hydrolase FlgJ [Variovorax sp. NFACC26]SFG42328.1 Flagellum-specific peptidoglycan hydrolase FlgJ [Variovorax sp. NFACC27]
MATVIDALVVTLGLDAAKFKKGSKETDEALDKTSGKANKANKDMEAWGKNAASSMSKLRNEVLGLLAVFTAGIGIKQFVENTISSTASLGRMSQNLDMSAKSLAQWQLANKNAGGSVEGMTAQLQEAQKAVSDYRLGISNSANAGFWSTGLAKDSDFKNAETLLRARANAVQTITSKWGVGIGRTKAAEMGISEDTFNLLKQGAAQVDKVRDSVEKLAEAQARASAPAEAFRQKWDLVQGKLQAVGVTIVSKLLPYLERFATWLDQNQDKIEAWAIKAVAAIEGFVKLADKAAESVGGWKNVLIALLALNVLSAVAPFAALAASLLSVGNALGVIGGTAGTSALAVLGKLGASAAALGGGYWLGSKLNDQLGKSDAGRSIQKAIGDAGLRIFRNATFGLFEREGVTLSADSQARAGLASGAPNAAPSPSTAAATTGAGPAAFAAKYGAAAAKAGAALGVDSRAILGQWGLETGWGKSIIPGTNNLGNIKDFSGSGVSAKDNMTGSVDKYRAYASADAFADDYISLIKRKYPGAVGATSAEAFAQALKKGGYAEDPAYVSKMARASQMAGLGGAAGATGAAQVSQAAAPRANTRGSGSTTTVETNFNGPITVTTQAKDAEGVAGGMEQALSKRTFAAQANTGLS